MTEAISEAISNAIEELKLASGNYAYYGYCRDGDYAEVNAWTATLVAAIAEAIEARGRAA